MAELYETEIAPKRALLISIRSGKSGAVETESMAKELAGLVKTLGFEIAAQETVHIRENHPKFGMGTGKAEEMAEKAAELEADCLVFDGDLSPSQQRNWERLTGISAVDRQELIIQIFAGRAKTREAELQVSLAELYYTLPRLTHKYIDLSRQRGGRYGTKGSGETKLETDRRQIEQRIHRLKEELEGVRKNRETQRKKRDRDSASCALVGYTNSGKSSLLNALTGADVLAEDKLFATLDATTRVLPSKGRTLVISDTVGFIRRLPHALINAFRSTLEETAQADLLIHVLDASDPDIDQYFETTLSVLRELGAVSSVEAAGRPSPPDKKPMLTVLNKIDRLEPPSLDYLLKRYPGSIPVSALTGAGLEELVLRIDEALSGPARRFRFPPNRSDLAAMVHRNGTVLSESYEDTYIEIEARLEESITEKLREYLDTELNDPGRIPAWNGK
ncbi:GTP-binding protein HflX [Treponema primitia ZAS-2]|uniref:GTPase HflX n=1 Tax=Treponema primitia (strain ATCC BAA-887 / DSM 12427 / ZAS-2) TaxID=545694 RepID=F5YK46_TREPZ|nr:GTPase HflX [Treponema primitia]AEF84513.1 GTP-binding protein HflX [Treponema primitia ZAS-2]